MAVVVWWWCGVVVGVRARCLLGGGGGSRVLRVRSMCTWCLMVSVASVAVRVGVRSVAGCGAVRRVISRMSRGALCALCAPQTLYLHFALKCHYIVCGILNP